MRVFQAPLVLYLLSYHKSRHQGWHILRTMHFHLGESLTIYANVCNISVLVKDYIQSNISNLFTAWFFFILFQSLVYIVYTFNSYILYIHAITSRLSVSNCNCIATPMGIVVLPRPFKVSRRCFTTPQIIDTVTIMRKSNCHKRNRNLSHIYIFMQGRNIFFGHKPSKTFPFGQSFDIFQMR